MDNEDLFYYLALQSVKGIGPVNAKRLLDHFGGIKEVFRGKSFKLKKVKGLPGWIRPELSRKELLERAERELEFILKNNIRPIGFKDQTYPSKLKHCEDAPILLFQKGDFDINGRKTISIVGTRMMTSYGRGFLREFVQQLKKHDPIIVSGLAFGVDICAHLESLSNEICTVGVLAHGLDRVYPRQHKGIAGRMLSNGGFYTEFWSGTAPERENFIKRNRIIAGISEVTLVVESADKGGSLITAQLASSYNREVLAVPGRATDRFSQGCNMLIKKNRAAMITSAQDLEYLLGWELKPPGALQRQKRRPVSLSEDEKQLYELLDPSEKKLLDELCLESGFSIQKTVALLLQLELKELVMSHSGKRYQAK